jgi:hypothetical protein
VAGSTPALDSKRTLRCFAPRTLEGSGRSIRLLFALRQAGFAQSFDDSLMNALKVGSSLQWMPAQV